MLYVLEPGLCNTFTNEIESENEFTLSKFVDDTMLSGAADSLQGSGAIQRDLDRLEEWPHRVQQTHVQDPAHGLGQSQIRYRVRDELTGSSLAEENWEILVDEKFDASQKVWSKPKKSILSFTNRSVVSRLREVIRTIYSTLERPHLKYCISCGVPAQERHGPLGEGPKDDYKSGLGGWNTSPVKKG